MDPHEVFATDRDKFNHDLSLLIDTAAAAVSSSSNSDATTPSTARTSPPMLADPRIRKRSLAQPPLPSKKAKLEGIKLGTPESTSTTASPPRAHNTRADTISLSSRKGPNRTWDTLRNAVHRQWDTRKDGLAYEQLVAKRRAERLVNIDRYIPGEPLDPSSAPLRRTSRTNKPFPFDKLADKIQDKILTLALVREDPLVIDFTWLRPFINGHCRIPTTTKTFKVGNITHTMPLNWNTIIDVSLIHLFAASSPSGRSSVDLVGCCQLPVLSTNQSHVYDERSDADNSTGSSLDAERLQHVHGCP